MVQWKKKLKRKRKSINEIKLHEKNKHVTKSRIKKTLSTGHVMDIWQQSFCLLSLRRGGVLILFHINWLGAPHKSNFFFFFPLSPFIFAMSQFDLPITKKSLNYGGSPQNRRFYGKMKCLPLWPSYIGEKGRNFGQKTYGIKSEALLGTPLRNTLGT
jgi:hypothetical protein